MEFKRKLGARATGLWHRNTPNACSLDPARLMYPPPAPRASGSTGPIPTAIRTRNGNQSPAQATRQPVRNPAGRPIDRQPEPSTSHKPAKPMFTSSNHGSATRAQRWQHAARSRFDQSGSVTSQLPSRNARHASPLEPLTEIQARAHGPTESVPRGLCSVTGLPLR